MMIGDNRVIPATAGISLHEGSLGFRPLGHRKTSVLESILTAPCLQAVIAEVPKSRHMERQKAVYLAAIFCCRNQGEKEPGRAALVGAASSQGWYKGAGAFW